MGKIVVDYQHPVRDASFGRKHHLSHPCAFRRNASFGEHDVFMAQNPSRINRSPRVAFLRNALEVVWFTFSTERSIPKECFPHITF